MGLMVLMVGVFYNLFSRMVIIHGQGVLGITMMSPLLLIFRYFLMKIVCKTIFILVMILVHLIKNSDLIILILFLIVQLLPRITECKFILLRLVKIILLVKMILLVKIILLVKTNLMNLLALMMFHPLAIRSLLITLIIQAVLITS